MAGGGASMREFDGFVLNLVLAPVGIVGGLVVAIPLAIGRASSLRVVSWTCTTYIEVVRGAPLLGWLFVALFILDDVVGGDLVVRAAVVLAVFTGAYMAEYIRGALQAMPRGQYEAAHSVGLNRAQSLRLIILPQALRNSIPPIVGQAISIWKDTTLVTVILPLRELKGNADSAIAQFRVHARPDRGLPLRRADLLDRGIHDVANLAAGGARPGRGRTLGSHWGDRTGEVPHDDWTGR